MSTAPKTVLLIQKPLHILLINKMSFPNTGPWPPKGEKYNAIPRDLLPKTTNKITDAWSRDTYKYFHYFDASVESRIINNEDDLRNWQTYAIKMMNELKNLGLAEARNEIVRLANQTFKITKKNGTAITEFENVAALYEDKEWYFEDEDYNRRMLYVFQYGIFRNGYNGWLHNASVNWMHENRVVYEEPVPRPTHSIGPKPKTKKGFILELLHIKASNTIQDRFLRTTRKKLGQHLLCRKKLPDSLPDELSPKLLTFNNYNAYLIVNKTHECYVDKPAETPQNKFKASVRYAMSKGISQEALLQLIASCYNNQGKCNVPCNCKHCLM